VADVKLQLWFLGEQGYAFCLFLLEDVELFASGPGHGAACFQGIA
jgi:hypothetical protein